MIQPSSTLHEEDIKWPEPDPEPEIDLLWTEEEELDCMESVFFLLCDYIESNPCAITEPDFEEVMVDNVKEVMMLHNPCETQVYESQVCGFFDVCRRAELEAANKRWEGQIEYALEGALELLYATVIPPRSYASTFLLPMTDEERAHITKKVVGLQGVPQPTQRTAEWYAFRHNLITASNAYKAFESAAVQNQLIYEKCMPCKTGGSGESSYVNVDSTLHYGQKYEPLSVMYYEHTYNTQVIELGCIVHPQYPFLGASPDGINFDKQSDKQSDKGSDKDSDKDTILERHGRMLEIKNIVNREIDGIPKKEYWVQMQLQLETCDLDSCDFLETRFVEYENEAAFKEDTEYGLDMFLSRDGMPKGVIMYFADGEGRPVYKYKPWTMKADEYEDWYTETMTQMTEGSWTKTKYTWICNKYWKLEEVSCVLVLRNRLWFQENIGQLAAIWSTIEKERVSGYIHRAPKSRPSSSSSSSGSGSYSGLGQSGLDVLLKVVKLGL